MQVFAEGKENELSRDIQQTCILKGVPYTFNVGKEELEIAVAAHEAMGRMNTEEYVVVQGLHRNCMLAWKPDPTTGKLQACDTMEHV